MYQLISSLKVMPSSKAMKDRFLTCSLVDRKVTASCDFSSGSIYREQDGINYCRGKQLLSGIFIPHRSSFSLKTLQCNSGHLRTWRDYSCVTQTPELCHKISDLPLLIN